MSSATKTKEKKKFKCNECGKEYVHKKSLNRHSHKHTKLKTHECRTCHKTFPESSNLSRHIKTHNDEKPFQCKYSVSFGINLLVIPNQICHSWF